MEADQEAVEQVSEILSRACPGGVSVEAPFEVIDEGLAARFDARRPAVVRGYVSAVNPAAARAAADHVKRDLGHLQAFALRPIGDLVVRVVHEDDWAEAWKEHFPVMRVGRRLVIRPTWHKHSAQSGEVVISLDPGMAFGTGLHPTTRLCLEGLEGWAENGRVAGGIVLDVGCGSGILAIAAALLGARSVLAIDTDALAVETTRQNAHLNGVAALVEARPGSLPLAEPGAAFDIVLANLVASVLVDLADELAAVVRSDGRLLASGIFADREDEVRKAFESTGMRVVDRLCETDWVALEVEKVG